MGWQVKPLGEVVTLQRGFDLPKQDRQAGAVPIVSSSGVSGTHNEARVLAPGVVTGRYGCIGQVHFVETDFWPLNTTLFVKDFKGNDPRFVSYLLRTIDFASCSDKSSVPGVNRNDLHRLLVAIPDIPEQRHIAETLGALDDKIELNRRTNRTLESIARAIFKSWFVDFDPVRKKMDGGDVGLPPDLAALFQSSLVPSSLGSIPAGWRIASIGEVAVELEAGSRPRGGVGDIDCGIPSIGAESIVGIGRFDYAKTKRVPRDFWSGMRRGHVRDRDVLVYKDGGRPGMFEPHATMIGEGFPFDVCCINEHVYRLRVSSDLSQTYTYFWLTSDLAMSEMRERGTGVAIPSLNSTAFRAVPILVPDAAIVDRFSGDIEPVVAAMLTNAKESRTLEIIRDALLPKLILGKAATS